MNKLSVAVAFQKLQARIARLQRDLTLQDLYWLWRSSLITERQAGGFVLPTTILLLLMLSLVLGILIFRTGSRNVEIIGDRQQRQIYNAATPAVHRAQSKLEFLFTQEPLPPLPSDLDLREALLTDTYTLDDETRLELDGDPATVDPAWQFTFDADGDRSTGTNGREVTVAYSILSNANAVVNGQRISFEAEDAVKARAQVVRRGPINLQGAANPNCTNLALAPRAGWVPITSATLRKPLQVNAFAKNELTGVSATLEMQQDRQANTGNKWGAWFRYDLEIFPGPEFRWNGAMHTEANLMAVGANAARRLSMFLISSPASCVYSRDATEISVAGDPGNPNNFVGQVITGEMRNNTTTGNFPLVHNFAETLPLQGGRPTPTITELRREIDSVNANVRPIDISVEPVLLYTEDRNRSRNLADPLNQAARDPGWADRDLAQARRIYNDPQERPFVDDTYRADNRWGPRPQYTSSLVMNEDANNNGVLDTDEDSNRDGQFDRNLTGERITAAYTNVDDLTRTIADDNDETLYGFDGYWERRARAQGVRLIVGQRLELGNANGWVNEDVDNDGILDADEDLNNNGQLDFDPLNPPAEGAADDSSQANRSHEQRQWRTLRDNLAAVQTTAVYHYLNDGGDYPVACLASTAHPGTTTTRNNSRTFNALPGVAGRLDVDFLTGNGTNGIEFSAPFSTAVNPEGAFATAVNDTNSPLRRALTNLARFAGDPAGGFPAEQDTVNASANNAAARYAHFSNGQAVGVVHPYPQLTMWGDFSNLRRVITYLENDTLDSGDIGQYEDLSPADQSTLHTATCTLGALAYNLDNREQQYNAALAGGPSLNSVGVQLFRLMDGNPANGEIGTDGDRHCRRNSFNGADGCPSQNPYTVGNPNDPEHYSNYYAQFTTEDWVEALRSNNNDNHADRLEELSTVFQIRRDRALGFARNQGIPGRGGDSPGYDASSGTYDLDESEVGNGALGRGNNEVDESSIVYEGVGCDPAQFTLNESPQVGLAMAICSATAPPKYPSLFYLFPLSEHAPDGQLSALARGTGMAEVLQPQAEPYVDATLHPYIFDRAGSRGINCRRIPGGGTCQDDTFRPVGEGLTPNGIESAGEDGIAALMNQLGMRPRLNRVDWLTPVTDNDAGRINEITVNGVDLYPAFLDKGFFNGRELMAVRSLDLDLDLLRRSSFVGINRFQSPPAADTDYWLPLPTLTNNGDPTRTGALIYAFREDAIREDAIARPRLVTDTYGDWLDNWLTFVNDPEDAAIASYVMNAVGRITTAGWNPAQDPSLIATDPPINPRTGISPKPVDFYPDPDRRAHGFRLRKGRDLRRVNGNSTVTGTDAQPELRGLSFVSDNAVYIQSDDNEFNWHTEEEFTEDLSPENWNNFYDRQTLNLDFAGRTDRWRPTEIIADAITLVSANFTEGTIARGIRDSSAGSFNGLNHSDSTNRPWVREDGQASSDRDYRSPIKISQRGFPVYCVQANNNNNAPDNQPCDDNLREVEYGREQPTIGGNNRNYIGINNSGRSNNTPDRSFFNGVIVSGIVPSRGGQSFGGLHNFPRFIERWNRLFISGSLIQLNFSTSATGPFDKDSWEPGAPPQAGRELISYYGAPRRFWGYDVALQYSPAGPVSERFVTRSDLRSEFYQELPIEDPYILGLRCATPAGGGNSIDPDVQGCPP